LLLVSIPAAAPLTDTKKFYKGSGKSEPLIFLQNKFLIFISLSPILSYNKVMITYKAEIWGREQRGR
jgi:hypothetical protein